MKQAMTALERDAKIRAIEVLARGIAEDIDWRRDSDPRICRISLAPNGHQIKVVTVPYQLKNISRTLRYYLDNEGDLYVGGELGFGNQRGTKVVLKDRSDAVLIAVANALSSIADSPVSH